MKSPYTGKEMELRNKKVILNFRKEEFECVFHYYYCADTNDEFEDDRLSWLNMQQVTDQYREKHNIPFPEQIKSIRQNYGLSAAKMSELLGLGINSWRLYENGDVPTVANARLIQLISDPQNFLKHVSEFGTCTTKEIEKIKKKVDELNRKKEEAHFFETRFQNSVPGNTTGYTIFNKEKTEQVVLFFAKRMAPYKTSLNKLLFYTDFFHFKQTGRSVTGLRYVAIDFGPVPDHFNSLYEMMTDEGIIEIEGNITEFGFTERMVVTDSSEIKETVFIDSELNTMNEVFKKLQGKSAKELVELSHREQAWIQNNKAKSLIPYTFAYQLVTF